MANMDADSRSRTTLEDVARAAGTSAATASRALNGQPGVRPQVREAVERAARDLGYAPNSAARSLAHRQTGLIGIVVSDGHKIIDTRVFSGFLNGAVTAIQRAGYHAVVMIPEDDRKRDELGGYIKTNHLDGAIIVGHRDHDPLVSHLAVGDFPVVCFGRPIGHPGLWYVDVDNAQGARMGMRHLIDRGHRAIGILAGPQDRAWGEERLSASLDALRIAGHEIDRSLVGISDFTAADGYASALRLLVRRPDVDAIFCHAENITRGALHALADRGLRATQDVSIVTFDDGPADRFAPQEGLTSIKMPLEDLGEEAARLLVSRLNSDSRVPRRSILTPELLVRDSASPVRPLSGGTNAQTKAGSSGVSSTRR